MAQKIKRSFVTKLFPENPHRFPADLLTSFKINPKIWGFKETKNKKTKKK